jgi:integrase
MDEKRTASTHTSWNKGKLVGQKSPFKVNEIWAIRTRLQLQHRVRELALFNLGIDSKLRGCDLLKLRVQDICHGDRVSPRAMVMQQKTSRPVQFEITEPTRNAVNAWITSARLRADGFLFPSRIHKSPHLGTRQYARIVGSRNRAGPLQLRNPFDAPYQSHLDLPQDQKPQSGAVAAWAHQA